jgi:outer membrane lipopolysaccharide assembly protein LptE/RlpB
MVAGCGYTTGSLVPSGLKTVYVESFENKTSEPGLEIDVTNQIKDRFIQDGALDVADSKEKADSMLTGEIIGYEKKPLSYATSEEVAEYELVLTVNVKYIDLVNNEVLWEEKNFEADSEFYSILEQQRFGSTNIDEEQLQTNAIKELARRIVDRTVEGW